MFFQTASIIIGLSIFAILSTSVNVSATKLNFSDDFTSNFTNNLKSKIQDLVSSALNETNSTVNYGSVINNLSNLSSSQLLISKNKVVSSVNNNESGGSSSTIKNKVTTINGVCNSIKVGGEGNDTLYSSGNCNDEFTGGLGADKFTCGEGNDTITDFNPKEGDVMTDEQSCEKILEN
jgi:Ca2+-binding RTX toxin-like protein